MATLLSLVLALSIHACIAVEVPTVTLMNSAQPGTKMPVSGIGTGSYGQPGETWDDDIAEKAIGEWLKMGGRRIDTAFSYNDQVGIGKAIKASVVSRKDLFITSKVGSAHGGSQDFSAGLGYNDTLAQIKPVLDTLQVDYVDLLLLHWPGPPGKSTDPACQGNPSPTWRECRQSTWRAMEEIYKMGKARAIGVSNFEKYHLEDIIVMNSTLPAVNQVEFHPYWHESDLLALCKSYNITLNGYSPVGCPDWAPTTHHWNHTLLQEPDIMQIAQSHKRTPAQVVLRWQWQLGVVSNPRTVNPQHMMENLNYFDFELSSDEINTISNVTPPPNRKVCLDPHTLL